MSEKISTQKNVTKNVKMKRKKIVKKINNEHPAALDRDKNNSLKKC